MMDLVQRQEPRRVADDVSLDTSAGLSERQCRLSEAF